MSQRGISWRSRAWAPYWYVIVFFLLGALTLYIIHLNGRFTPDRVAFSVLDFNVYWYGIIISFGIALGAFVVAHLVQERARLLFRQAVPLAIAERDLDSLSLDEELHKTLLANNLRTLGDVLYRWPFGAPNLGLNAEGYALLGQSLVAERGVKKEWVEDAPWRQWNPEHVWNGLLWCLVLAVIGARLYHVFTPSPSMAEVGIYSPADYFRNPMQLINLRRGGLGIFGGIAGGALGLLFYSRRHRISGLGWADVAVIGVALGQFVGRWGNFFNQELYGRPTDVPWAVYIDPQYRLPDYTAFNTFHPAFLYESLWNLLAFGILITLWYRFRHRRLPGDIMGAYLILYGIGRILMETVRLDSRTFAIGQVDFGLPIASVVSLVIAVVMLLWIVWRHRNART